MATGAAGSVPVDVLAQFPVLSLFPPTFAALQNVSGPYDLERELDSLHSHLGIIALQSPKKHLDKAKAIMEGCSELLSIDAPSEDAGEEKQEVDGGKANENPKKRRPAVGLKRPKFSLKPDSSQPAVSLGGAFDIDSYDDPDMYFAAYERVQYASREIMRQNGIVPEDPGQHLLKEARPRRPGLLGRSYKHIFSESGEFLHEPVIEAHVAISDSTVLEDAKIESNDKSLERDFTASTKAEKTHNELLEELLSQNLEDLDGDGAANLIQEHLQIESINIENLELPQLKRDIRKDDLNASVGKLSKQRRALSDIQNTTVGPHVQPANRGGGSEGSKSYLSSKSAAKSPLAPISSFLKKRQLTERSSINPFSSAYVVDMAARSSLGREHTERQIEDVNKRNRSVVSSPHPGESTSVPFDTRQFDVAIGPNSNDLQNEVANHDLSIMAECLDRSSTDLAGQAEKDAATSSHLSVESEDSSAAEANKDDDVLGPLVSSTIEDFAGDDFSKCPGRVVEQQIEVPASDQEEKEEASSTQLDAEIDSNTGAKGDGDFLGSLASSEIEEFAKDGSSKCPGGVIQQQIEEPIAPPPSRLSEKKSCPSRNSRKRKGASTPGSFTESGNLVATEHHQNKRADDAEELTEEAPRELHNGQRISRPRPKKSCLEKDRRTSLGDAGTTWDNGVRRSTRIRSRPLAFWKGERFLYGRIHESLATVIGVKYESPGDADRKPSLKVKSFVSNEYKELIDLVSS